MVNARVPGKTGLDTKHSFLALFGVVPCLGLTIGFVVLQEVEWVTYWACKLADQDTFDGHNAS